jgi:hypothetical protein
LRLGFTDGRSLSQQVGKRRWKMVGSGILEGLRRARIGVAAAGVVVLALAWAGAVVAAPLTIPAGFDLFVSPPGHSAVNLGPIGIVQLQGQPTGPMGHDPSPFMPLVEFDELGMLAAHGVIDHRLAGGLSMVDTIVERPAPASLPMIGDMDIIPIEIISLSLHSVSPIMADFGGGPSFFDVFVTLDPMVSQSVGSMTLTRTGENSGLMDTTLPVSFKLEFLPVGGGMPVTMPGTDTLMATRVPWGIVPEPSTFLLLGSGLAGLAVWRRKRFTNQAKGE